MTPTLLLLPGAGGTAWYWHRVVPLLAEAGRRPIAVDLPNRPGTTIADQADAVVAAGADAAEVVLVAQSMAGFVAPLAVDRLLVAHLVLLNAMVPRAGETPGEWWDNVGQVSARRAADVAAGRDPDAPFDPAVTFFHDVDEEITAVAFAGGDVSPAESLFETAYDLPAWPDVPTVVLMGRDDRLFPPDLQRRVAQERLGLPAEELPGGHLLALSQPRPLVDRLLAL